MGSTTKLLLLPALSCALLLAAAGCHRGSPAPTPEDRANQQALLETQHEQMLQIPDPTKGRYMAVHTFDSWMNPYLTVQAGMLGLHVTRGDANTTPIGVGGMLRPIGARRVVLNIGNDQLGDAMTAIPPDAWPYGRVVAIEQAHQTPRSALPAVQRNMDRVIAELHQLGIVVYDPTSGNVL